MNNVIPQRHSQWWHYGIAIGTVAIAVLIKLLLALIIEAESPFILFFAAVLISAWYGGRRAGFLAVGLAAVSSNFFFISPLNSFIIETLGNWVQLGIFIGEGGAITTVVVDLNHARREAEISKANALHYQQIFRDSEERFRLFVANVKDYAIFMLDSEARIISWNNGAENMFGFTEAEIVGKHISHLYLPTDIESGLPEQKLQTAIAHGNTSDEGWRIRKDGTYFWANCVLTALRDRTGNLRGFAKVVRDFTERKQAAAALQKVNDELELKVQNRTSELLNTNEQLQSEVLERLQTEQALLDSQTRMQLINSISTAMMLGIAVEQIVERTIKQLSENFNIFRISYSTVTPDGTLTIIHSVEPQGLSSLQGVVINLNNVPAYLYAVRANAPIVIEDIIKDSRLAAKAKSILAHSTQALLNVPFIDSENLIRILSFDSRVPHKWSEHEIATLIVIAQYLSIIFRNAHTQKERDRAETALQQAHDELEVRVFKRTAELARKNVELKTEIIERKRAEAALRQSEERLRFALDAADMVAWDWNTSTDEISQSPNAERVIGLPPATTIKSGKDLLNLIHPKDRVLVLKAFKEATLQGKDYICEYRIILPDGSIRWIADQGRVNCDISHKTLYVSGVIRDITTHKQVADQIKASLAEKEVLLKEIHHRVKNNLQIISSLLNLQSGYVDDEQILEILKAGENRVASMALIHEQLYQSKNLARIDFKNYIQELAANLFSSYNVDSEKIRLTVNIDQVFLGLDVAIPCGLIINELVSNSLKYAFDSRAGEIYIKLLAGQNNFLLIVRDNGSGLPHNLDFRNTESLGLQIVIALTNQLEGSIELNTDCGTEFRIQFPKTS